MKSSKTRQQPGADMNDENRDLIDQAYEELSSVEGLFNFLADENRAMEAYLTLRNRRWRSPSKADFFIGWITCSTLVARLRGLDDVPTAFWWRGHRQDQQEPTPEPMNAFLSLIALAGWVSAEAEPALQTSQ